MEEMYIYAGRSTVQSLLNIDDQVSEVAITGHDYRDVDNLYQLVKNAADEDAEVRSWTELDTYLGLMLGVMDGFVLVWIIVIFLALSFGLVNTLMMAVFERVREFGLMQALGMKPAAIRYQVLAGVRDAAGAGLAGRKSAGRRQHILPIQDGIDLSAVAEGMEMMGVSSVLYPALKLKDILLANTVVIVLGILTSLLPAWRASQYQPRRSHRKNLKERTWPKSNVSNCARTTSKVTRSSKRWTMSRSTSNRARLSACPARPVRVKPPC